jgi:hypothetical protein
VECVSHVCIQAFCSYKLPYLYPSLRIALSALKAGRTIRDEALKGLKDRLGTVICSACHGCGWYIRNTEGISCGKNFRGEQSLANSGLSQASDGHRKTLAYRYPQETIGFSHGLCRWAIEAPVEDVCFRRVKRKSSFR